MSMPTFKNILKLCALLLILVGTFHTLAAYFMSGLEEAESQDFKERHLSAMATLDATTDEAKRVVEDWGNWDALWNFAAGTHPKFIDDNEPQHDLRVLELAAYAVYSKTGYRFGAVIEGEDPEILNIIKKQALKVNATDGWAVIENRGYFLTSGAIVAPTRKGSSGRLFVAKRIAIDGFAFSATVAPLASETKSCTYCHPKEEKLQASDAPPKQCDVSGRLAASSIIKAPDGSVVGSWSYSVDRRLFLMGKRHLISLVLLGLLMAGSATGVSASVVTRIRRRYELLERNLQKVTVLGAMMPNLIHEIKNPLAIACGFLDFARDPVKGPHAVEKTGAALKRIEAILNGVRSYARTDTGWHVQDLNQVVRDAVSVMPHLLKSSVSIREFIWPEPLLYLGSEDALHQIVSNLFTNARDALEETHPAFISIRTHPEENDIVLEISDNGPGIPKAIREKVFKKFYTTKAVGKGTGLGLSIVRQLVEDMHGEIAIGDSELGGALITIKLPLGRKAKDETAHS